MKPKKKKDLIADFLQKNKTKFADIRCADAWKEFVHQHGDVAYVYFNRAFREIFPNKKNKKKRRPAPRQPEKKTSRYSELITLKNRTDYYARILRDNEQLLEDAIKDKDGKMIEYYRDIRDRDRRAMVMCYEEIIEYYESKKLSEVIKQAEEERKKIDEKKQYGDTASVLEEAAEKIKESSEEWDDDREPDSNEIDQAAQGAPQEISI